MVLTGVGLGFLLDPKWLRINILISKNGKIVIFCWFFFWGGRNYFWKIWGGTNFFLIILGGDEIFFGNFGGGTKKNADLPKNPLTYLPREKMEDPLAMHCYLFESQYEQRFYYSKLNTNHIVNVIGERIRP